MNLSKAQNKKNRIRISFLTLRPRVSSKISVLPHSDYVIRSQFWYFRIK